MPHRIHNLLAMESILLLILAALAGNAVADIHLKDTYYVFSLRQIFIALALMAGLLFLICFAGEHCFKRQVLSIAHIVGTLLLFSAIDALLWQSVYHLGPGAIDDYTRTTERSGWLRGLFYAALTWQILLPINLLLSLQRQRK